MHFKCNTVEAVTGLLKRLCLLEIEEEPYAVHVVHAWFVYPIHSNLLILIMPNSDGIYSRREKVNIGGIGGDKLDCNRVMVKNLQGRMIKVY